MGDVSYTREQFERVLRERGAELEHAIVGRMRDSGGLRLDVRLITDANGQPTVDVGALNLSVARMREIMYRETLSALVVLLFAGEDD